MIQVPLYTPRLPMMLGGGVIQPPRGLSPYPINPWVALVQGLAGGIQAYQETKQKFAPPLTRSQLAKQLGVPEENVTARYDPQGRPIGFSVGPPDPYRQALSELIKSKFEEEGGVTFQPKEKESSWYGSIAREVGKALETIRSSIPQAKQPVQQPTPTKPTAKPTAKPTVKPTNKTKPVIFTEETARKTLIRLFEQNKLTETQKNAIRFFSQRMGTPGLTLPTGKPVTWVNLLEYAYSLMRAE